MSTSAWLRTRGRPFRRELALTIALGEASGILLILQTALLVRIGNGVIFQRAASEPFVGLLALLLVVIAGRVGVSWGSRRAAFACASGVKQTLRSELVDHLRDIGPIALSSMRAGEIANTAVDGVEALDAYYSKYLPQRAVATLLPFTILAVVFPLDWISGLLLVLTAVFLPLNMMVIGEEAHARNQRLWARLASLSGRFLDVLQGLSTVRMFGAAAREAAAIERASEDYRATTLSVLRVAFLSSLVLELISAVSIALVAILSGLRLLAGTMQFAPAYFILLVAPEYFFTLRQLGTFYHARMEAVSAAEHVTGLLAAATIKTAHRPVEAPGVVKRPPSIVFDGVSFSYSSRAVLHRAFFSIRPGERVAVVGPSGAGKTTILKLLLRFILPSEGSVTVDGRDLLGLETREWLREIAWLPQLPTLFHGTLLENIRLGRLEATDREAMEAGRLAFVDEFAERLPLGYGTLVGERGQGISGGQLQRVALARLFLRNPGLVLLDEPTAHLDRASERLVEAGIETLAKGRTVILVTHRRSAAGTLDRVLAVEDGGVRSLS